MHFNKPQNELLQNDKTVTSHIDTTAITSETATKKTTSPTSLIIEASAKKIRNTVTLEASDQIATITGTTTSCTSSTDSGVNISDNETTLTPSPLPSPLSQTVNPFNREYNKNNNKKTSSEDKNNINNFNNDDDVDVVKTLNNSTNFDNKLKTKSEEAQSRQPHQHHQSTQQFLKVENSSNENNNFNNTPLLRNQFNNQKAIKSENVINISHYPTTKEAAITRNDLSQKQRRQQYNEYVDPLQQRSSSQSSLSMSSSTSSHQHHPPPNMQNNGSPAVSIRSIDSSVIDSDSDSDLSGDTEGVHENYVIKKLGTQVSYPPRHPDIPKINKGLRVLNQQITPNGGGLAPPSPLAALAVISDNLGAAQALGPVPSVSAVAQRPQIGSIALSNSSDVTFGDKHFYEGPVTIQQFLIDGRDKWKDSNGNENPSFENDNIDTHDYAKDINASSKQSSKLYGYISKRKKFVIPGVLAVTTLLIVAIILGSEALNDSKNTNSDDNIDDYDECNRNNGTLCLIDRDAWRAQSSKQQLDKHVKLPVHRAIISHTASEPCDTLNICSERVRIIQEFHMNSFAWDDIGYNFLISSDGLVFVGRGWDIMGAHTKGYNTDSVGITFIGTYTSIKPTEAQLNACRLLLEEGVRLKKLDPNYRLYGARQMGATESPGEMLYKIIKEWPHWSAKVL